jgi:hypothetical protein
MLHLACMFECSADNKLRVATRSILRIKFTWNTHKNLMKIEVLVINYHQVSSSKYWGTPRC